MSKQKDYFWTITKDEFVERLGRLKDHYHRDVWNYLQAYIIRGAGTGDIWTACYKIYKHSNILASSISINRMSRDLCISDRKLISVLQEMDEANHIIKFSSKSSGVNNTNIYIMGFLNTEVDTDSNIIRFENYFTNVVRDMVSGMRESIIGLYNKQLGIIADINDMTTKIQKIQDYLFLPEKVVNEVHHQGGE